MSVVFRYPRFWGGTPSAPKTYEASTAQTDGHAPDVILLTSSAPCWALSEAHCSCSSVCSHGFHCHRRPFRSPRHPGATRTRSSLPFPSPVSLQASSGFASSSDFARIASPFPQLLPCLRADLSGSLGAEQLMSWSN